VKQSGRTIINICYAYDSDTIFKKQIICNIPSPLTISYQEYPNPTHGTIHIYNAKGKEKKLFNSVGQLILNSKEDQLDLSHLPKGIYYLRIDGSSKKVWVQ
jgi:hypothetical protein